MAQGTKPIAEAPYTIKPDISKKPIPVLTVDFLLDNLKGTKTPFRDWFWLDTGFDRELKHNAQFGNNLITQGIYGADRTCGTADRPAKGKLFSAEITQVTGKTTHTFPNPIPVGLLCFGPVQTAPLLGLGLMHKWVTTFNGPAKFFNIIG